MVETNNLSNTAEQADQDKKHIVQRTYLDVIREANKTQAFITYRTIICGELGKETDSIVYANFYRT
jgi:hypothetical protein